MQIKLRFKYLILEIKLSYITLKCTAAIYELERELSQNFYLDWKKKLFVYEARLRIAGDYSYLMESKGENIVQ